MKKVWKIILSIALIIIVGVAGTSYYFLKVKTYDVADKKVDEIANSKYNIVLPGETKPGKQSETNNRTDTVSATNLSKEIKEKYRPTFKSLEDQAYGKIDSLIAVAVSEYEDKKANGESISFPYFYQKYNSAGGNLENQTDATFDYVYHALQSDLENNGFNPEDANSFKASYENTKKERQSALLSKAKAALF